MGSGTETETETGTGMAFHTLYTFHTGWVGAQNGNVKFSRTPLCRSPQR